MKVRCVKFDTGHHAVFMSSNDQDVPVLQIGKIIPDPAGSGRLAIDNGTPSFRNYTFRDEEAICAEVRALFNVKSSPRGMGIFLQGHEIK